MNPGSMGGFNRIHLEKRQKRLSKKGRNYDEDEEQEGFYAGQEVC